MDAAATGEPPARRQDDVSGCRDRFGDSLAINSLPAKKIGLGCPPRFAAVATIGGVDEGGKRCRVRGRRDSGCETKSHRVVLFIMLKSTRPFRISLVAEVPINEDRS